MAAPKQPSKTAPARQDTTELARRDPAAIAAKQDVPEYLRLAPGQSPEGFDEMERGDVTIPRLALCQSMSHQRKRNDPKFIPGLEEGQYFNTITNQIYGEKVTLVPLLFFKSRIRFRDLDAGGGILCQAPDSKTGAGDPGGDCSQCPFARFADGEPPECMLFHNYAAVVLDKNTPLNESLVVVSMKSSALKVAKAWNSMMRVRRINMFGGIWEFTAVSQKNSKGDFFVPVIKPAGNVPPEQYEQAKVLFEMTRETQQAGRLHVDMEPDAGNDMGGDKPEI